MAVKPVNPPAFDAQAFVEPLSKAFPRKDGTPRPVYGEQLPRTMRWIKGDAEYDGKGLADAVKTNAVELNQHLSLDSARHIALGRDISDIQQRLAVLEAARGPFSSGSG